MRVRKLRAKRLELVRAAIPFKGWLRFHEQRHLPTLTGAIGRVDMVRFFFG